MVPVGSSAMLELVSRCKQLSRDCIPCISTDAIVLLNPYVVITYIFYNKTILMPQNTFSDIFSLHHENLDGDEEYCEYAKLRFYPGSVFLTPDCNNCTCSDNGLSCCG